MPPKTRNERRREARHQRERSDAAGAGANRANANHAAPAVEDTSGRYAPTTWGGATSGATELECPSGQRCLARRPGVQGLLKAGVLHNVDSLTKLVDVSVRRGQGKRPQPEITVEQLAADPAALDDVMHMIDKIVCYTVIAPRLEMPRNDPTNRTDGAIYVDDVDLMDKMFIFNFAVGGANDLATFREGFEESLRSLESQSGDANSSE